jgi:ABC-type branched-subunit amino acid transport system substrate-binding protein
MRRIHQLATRASAVVVLTVLCQVSAASANVAARNCAAVTVALAAPLSGDASSAGMDQAQWAAAFVRKWNEAHPLKIKLVVRDVGLSVSAAVRAYAALGRNQQVAAVIGPPSADQVRALAPLLRRYDLPLVSPTITSPDVSYGSLSGLFFRVIPSSAAQGPTDVEFLETMVPVGQTVIVLDDNQPAGAALTSYVASALSSAAYSVEQLHIDLNALSFDDVVAQIASANAAAVFLNLGVPPEAEIITAAAKTSLVKALFVGSDLEYSPAFVHSIDYVSFFAPDIARTPAGLALSAAIDSPGESRTSFGPLTFRALQLVALSAQEACLNGRVSRRQLRTALARKRVIHDVFGANLALAAGEIVNGRYSIYSVSSGMYTELPPQQRSRRLSAPPLGWRTVGSHVSAPSLAHVDFDRWKPREK